MSLFTIGQAAAICGASCTATGAALQTTIETVVVDSRQAGPGSLFVALAGAKADGSAFVADAARKQAVAAIVPVHALESVLKETSWSSIALIAVDDPLKALHALAKAHVAKYPAVRRIGVTGSCGKTTVKEMTASIMGCVGPTAKTPGNLNSEIGLPLALFAIDAHTRYGVFEMGIDHVGEMDDLVDIYRPHAGIITNIGLSHLGKMGSVRLIAHEKSKLFHPGIEHAFIGEHNAFNSYISTLRHVDLIPFGIDSTGGIGSIAAQGLQGWDIEYEGLPIRLRAIGRHNLVDALGAISLAKSMGAEPEAIRQGLQQFEAVEGRSRVLTGEVTVIEDCYNASMDSTGSILDYMGTVAWKGSKRVVLGSMKELGKASRPAHQEIGRRLARLRPASVTLYGPEMADAYQVLKQSGYEGNLLHTEDFDELHTHVMAKTHRGDLVLVKGSRAMAMERLVPSLTSIA